MLRLPRSLRVFASTKPAHFLRGIDGLVSVVRDDWGADPFAGDLFCFFNADRDRVKLLVWDRNGFWIFLKRLERGHFQGMDKRFPMIELEREELVMLLSGIDMWDSRFRKHFVHEVRIPRRADDEHRPSRASP